MVSSSLRYLDTRSQARKSFIHGARRRNGTGAEIAVETGKYPSLAQLILEC